MNSAGDMLAASGLLRRRLGSFWQHVFAQPKMVRGITHGYAELAAQVGADEDMHEASADRRAVAAHRRVRWLPVVLHPETRNTGAAAVVRINDAAPIRVGSVQSAPYSSPQPMRVGSAALREETTVYPTPGLRVAGPVIVDNPFAPTAWYWFGLDFVIEDSCILFLRGADPLGAAAEPVTVFMADAGTDSGLVGPLLNVFSSGELSGESAVRVLNAVWDIHNSGPTEAALRSLLAAMGDHPITGDTSETVELVTEDADGITRVITNVAAHKIPAGAALRDDVAAGTVLPPRACLTRDIMLFQPVPGRPPLDSQGYYDMRDLTSGVYLPAAVTGLSTGLEFPWTRTDLRHAQADDGSATYRFDIPGPSAVVELFWQRFDAINSEAERAAAFSDLPGFSATAEIAARLSPGEFILDNVLRGGMLNIVLSQALTLRATADKLVSRVLDDCLPAHVFVSMTHVVSAEDTADLSTATDSVQQGPGRYFVAAAGPDMLPSRRMRYRDICVARLTPV